MSATEEGMAKVHKGRHLTGNHAVHDIDVTLGGEVQPQLEVTPITKHGSDPGLVLRRHVAVYRFFISILNTITALRSLLRGRTQRVTDMAFFDKDVHLLASTSDDGRFYVWNITDEEDKPQVLGKIVVAIHILADGESVNPRVCWHPHKQEILMVVIGNRILKIESNRVGKGESDQPLNCCVDDLINGVQFVGKHDGEITELSMSQCLSTRLASASTDGTVKIWDDRKATPLAVLRPYDGQPVNSFTFLIGPHPQHIVLITGGPLNREVKIWASAEEEGWLLPSAVESSMCTQTLDLKSSRFEDVFFNQVVALNCDGLFLLANARKNAIYAVHIDYGPNPAATCTDYMAEFTVRMPILSLTGTSDGSPEGKHIVQVYCVQTQAIQQYALDLSQCLPSPLENPELEKTDSNAARAFDAANSNRSATFESSHGSKSADIPVSTMISLPAVPSSSTEGVPIASRPESLPSTQVTSLPKNASGSETKPSGGLPSHGNADNFHTASPPLPLRLRLSYKSSDFISPSNNYKVTSLLENASSSETKPSDSLSSHGNADNFHIASPPLLSRLRLSYKSSDFQSSSNSFELTSLSKNALSSETKPSGGLLSHDNDDNLHIASPPLPLKLRLSHKSSGFISPSNSYELTNLSENVLSSETKPSGGLLSHGNTDNFHIAPSPLPLKLRLSHKSSSFRSPSNSYELKSSSENASGSETKPSGGLLSHGNTDNFHIAPPPLPLKLRLSHKSSGFRSPSNSYELKSSSENASSSETKPSDGLPSHGDANNFHTACPPLPLRLRLPYKSSGFRSPSNSYEPSPRPNDLGGDQSVIDYSVDHISNTAKEKKVDVPYIGDNLWKVDRSVAQNDISMVPKPPVVFKHPTRLQLHQSFHLLLLCPRTLSCLNIQPVCQLHQSFHLLLLRQELSVV